MSENENNPADQTTSTPPHRNEEQSPRHSQVSDEQQSSPRASFSWRLLEILAPGSRQSGENRSKIATRLTYSAALCFLVILLGILTSNLLAEPTKRAEEKANDIIDSENPPFRTSSMYDWMLGYDPYMWALDRELTNEEGGKLSRYNWTEEPVEKYLESLGAHPVFSGWCPLSEGACGRVQVAMQVTGERDAQVNIVEMRTRKIECREPSAVTLIRRDTQGAPSVVPIFFQLDAPNPVAMVSDWRDAEAPPERFFSKKFLNLSKSAESVRLAVDVESKRTCTWVIEAEYETSSGLHRTVIDDQGKPFRVEAVPESPAQEWTVNRETDRFELSVE